MGHPATVITAHLGVGAAADLAPSHPTGSNSAPTRPGWRRCCWASPPPCSPSTPSRSAACPRPAGQALSAAAAITAGLATLIQRRVSTGQIKDWNRARSASEGLKPRSTATWAAARLHRPRPRPAPGHQHQRHRQRRQRPAASHPGHRTRTTMKGSVPTHGFRPCCWLSRWT